ncbi:DsbC family protein [Methylogaea oryzae]|uniref:Thiol:disulfide interchange protein n=2 Tax=Methylogaea oryzae TaxID=1295382 RepID=A0A8D4VMS1_9GAMM|nr:DsbC family protein [Methylogaea oryzae]BBL70743.1 hypothetical protein MoryE10_13490 [Methylogaea oryzae]
MLAALLAVAVAPLRADDKAIADALEKVFPGTKPESITPSEIPGLYEVVVGPTVFYMSGDGRYLIQGKMIDVEGHADVSEPKQAAARVAALAKIGESNMIVFAAKQPKYVVSIFTDIDCGYCRKLHSEIEQYLAEGITVRYLFFPRAGRDSDSYRKAVSVWCAKDRNAALTRAKRDEKVESKECDNPVDEHMSLGIAMGANGTPMIVTEGGEIIPGYVNAKQLAKMLAYEKSNRKPDAKDKRS